jgi:hypothetical protein
MTGELVDGKKRRGPYKISERTQVALDALCAGQTVAEAAAAANLTPRAVYTALKKDHVQTHLRQRVAALLSTGSVNAARTLLDLLKAKNTMTQFRAAAHILAINGVQPVQEKQPLVNINMGVKAGYVIHLAEPSDARSTPPELARKTIDLKAEAVDDERWPVVP